MIRLFLGLAALCAASAAYSQNATYTIDPAHTFPSFEADHMGISIWRGKLNKTSGKVTLDKGAGQGMLEVSMDLASIDFGFEPLNEWARSDKFFDTSKHPNAVYKGKLADFNASGPTRVAGELTMRGVTRPVDLVIHAFKCIPHPLYKRDLCGADASATFNRDEFGLDAGKPYGFRMDVSLRIQVEALADQ